MNDEQKAAEILGVEDPTIQEYLKKHPEKAAEIGQSLIELDSATTTAKDRAKDLEPMNRSATTYGIVAKEEPIYYRGLLKTPIILAFGALIALFVIIEIISLIATGHL